MRQLLLLFSLSVLYIPCTAQPFSSSLIVDSLDSWAEVIPFGDFEADGDMDIYVQSMFVQSEIVVYPNNGEDGIGAPVVLGEFRSALAMLAEDINGDGHPDLILSGNYAYGEVVTLIYWSTEVGSFDSPDTLGYSLSPDLELADLDLDGDLDLIMIDYYNDEILWLPYLEDQEFGEAVLIQNTLDKPQNISMIDMDQDGDLDLMAGYDDSYDPSHPETFVALSLNNGMGNFSSPQIIQEGTYKFWIMDIDGDTELDILIRDGGPGLKWHRNLGDNDFQFMGSFFDLGARPSFIEIFDVDLDGDEDIVFIVYGMGLNRLGWYENLNGIFLEEEVIEWFPSNTNEMNSGDFNGDGYRDILVSNGRNILLFQNTSVQENSDLSVLSSDFTILTTIDELAHSSITLFPNPMTTSAIIDLGELRGDFTLSIYDVTGKLLRSEQQTTSSQQLTLQREDLSPGQYLLRVVQEEQSSSISFTVE